MMYTELNNRTLWFDGETAVSPEQLLKSLNRVPVKYVTQPTALVDEYNKFVTKDQRIVVKDKCGDIDPTWTIPSKYATLDIIDYLFKMHDMMCQQYEQSERLDREARLAQELSMFVKKGLTPVIRAIIWIINTLTLKDQVWGIGRGSSVSSYVLYVIGAHDVDSYAYDLDVNDFLHEGE